MLPLPQVNRPSDHPAWGAVCQSAGSDLGDLAFGSWLLRLGYVDGHVCGAVHSTADVLRSALKVARVFVAWDLKR